MIMREIKFKARRVRPDEVNDVWVSGSLIQRIDSAEIFDGVFTWFVHPSTVCQYTGLKDKNGVEIYEGDIVKHNPHNITLNVEWIDEYACFAFVDKEDFNQHYYLQSIDEYKIKLIGNIHD